MEKSGQNLQALQGITLSHPVLSICLPVWPPDPANLVKCQKSISFFLMLGTQTQAQTQRHKHFHTYKHMHTHGLKWIVSSFSSHMTPDCCWWSFLIAILRIVDRHSRGGAGGCRVGGRHPIPWSPGVNFTNILRAPFGRAALKSVKKTDSLTVFFALLWYACL